MISVIRLHSENKPELIWDFIMAQHEAMNARLGGKLRLLYATRRVKYGDVSLFVHADEMDAIGDFVLEDIGRMETVSGVWVFNLIKPKFFPVPEGTLPDLPRFTLTIHAYPRHLQSVYESLCSTPPAPELVPAYIAYTFRTLGESVLCSVLAKDRKLVNQFKAKRVESLPGVMQVEIAEIQDTRRLLPRAEWEQYAHILPRDRAVESRPSP